MDEIILYEDPDVIVTNTRIKVGGSTHSLHGVTQIKTSSRVKNQKTYDFPPRIIIWPFFWLGVAVCVFAFHWLALPWTIVFLVLGARLPPRWHNQEYHLKINLVRGSKETLVYADACPLNPVDYNAGLSDHQIAVRKECFDRSMSRFNAVTNALSSAIGRADPNPAKV